MLFVSLWQVINTTFSFVDIAAGRGLAQPATMSPFPLALIRLLKLLSLHNSVTRTRSRAPRWWALEAGPRMLTAGGKYRVAAQPSPAAGHLTWPSGPLNSTRQQTTILRQQLLVRTSLCPPGPSCLMIPAAPPPPRPSAHQGGAED